MEEMADYLNDKERQTGESELLMTTRQKLDCPHCGKRLNINGGVKPKTCPFCRKPLDE
jgi:rubrerythrin